MKIRKIEDLSTLISILLMLSMPVIVLIGTLTSRDFMPFLVGGVAMYMLGYGMWLVKKLNKTTKEC